MSEEPTTPMLPPAEETSVVEDFIEIFTAPSKVFARRATKGFGIHLLIITLLTALFAFASRSVTSAIFDIEYQRGTAKAMEKNPQITQDMLDKMRPMQEGLANVFTYIGTPIFIFFIALLVWIVARLVGAKFSYGRAALIVTLAWIPRLIGSILVAIQAILMDSSKINSMFSVSLSPARFMDPDTTNPKLFGLVGNIEPFSIWCYVLIGIGIAVIGKVPRSKGYLAAAIVFVLGSLPILFR